MFSVADGRDVAHGCGDFPRNRQEQNMTAANTCDTTLVDRFAALDPATQDHLLSYGERVDGIISEAAGYERLGIEDPIDVEIREREDRAGMSGGEVCETIRDAEATRALAHAEWRAPHDRPSFVFAEWQVTWPDGTTTGWMDFEQTVAFVHELREHTGGIDPLMAVTLADAVDAGLIDSYDHRNFDGRAIFEIAATVNGEPRYRVGDEPEIRAALWGMTTTWLRHSETLSE